MRCAPHECATHDRARDQCATSSSADADAGICNNGDERPKSIQPDRSASPTHRGDQSEHGTRNRQVGH